jgi:hypothetical protein
MAKVASIHHIGRKHQILITEEVTKAQSVSGYTFDYWRIACLGQAKTMLDEQPNQLINRPNRPKRLPPS